MPSQHVASADLLETYTDPEADSLYGSLSDEGEAAVVDGLVDDAGPNVTAVDYAFDTGYDGAYSALHPFVFLVKFLFGYTSFRLAQATFQIFRSCRSL